MMEGFGMHGWWGMGWWWILGFILLVGVVWIIVVTVRRDREKQVGGEKTALDILKDRFARGEISKQEFEEKKKDLL